MLPSPLPRPRPPRPPSSSVNVGSFAHRPRILTALVLSFRSVYMSFGGLLMKLVGDPRHLEEAEMGSRLYILMKRIVR